MTVSVLSLPYGAVGWSAVDDCGIFRSYSLFVLVQRPFILAFSCCFSLFVVLFLFCFSSFCFDLIFFHFFAYYEKSTKLNVEKKNVLKAVI